MRSVEQEYKRLNEQIMPSDALMAKTRELMQAELSVDRVAARRKKQMLKKIASYAAVAAATAIVCVGVMRTLPLGETESAMENGMADMAMPEAMMEESAAEESFEAEMVQDAVTTDESRGEGINAGSESQREYADITIYYVQDGQIESYVQEDMDCSIDTIFEAWAQKNHVENVTVVLVDIQDSGASLGVHIDLSKELLDQLDADGLMIASLSMTVGEYLNADGVVLSCDGLPL